MTCLSTPEIQDALRGLIANQLYQRSMAEAAAPIDLQAYAKELYAFVEENLDSANAIIAVGQLPIMIQQIMSLGDEKYVKAIKAVNPELKKTAVDLEEDFITNGDERVRNYLALDKSLQEQLDQAEGLAKFNNNLNAQSKIEDEREKEIVPLPNLTIQTRPEFIKNIDDPSKDDYMVVTPAQRVSYYAHQNVSNTLSEQQLYDGILDSSEMQLEGVEGGVYLRTMSDLTAKQLYGNLGFSEDAYGIENLVQVFVDSKGNPILFDENGKVNPNGKIAYSRLDFPLPMINGKLITNSKDLDTYKEEFLKKYNITNQSDITAKKKLVELSFSRIKNMIADKVRSMTPQGTTLSGEELKAAEEIAIKELSESSQMFEQMRDYVLQNKDNFVDNVMTKSAGGKLLLSYVAVPLTEVNLRGGFNHWVEVKEQEEGSDYIPSVGYFTVPTANQPITIQRTPIVNHPDMLENIISLYTDPILTKAAGKDVALTAKEREALIEQFLSDSYSGIRFLSAGQEDGTRSYLDSKGRVTIEVAGQKYSFKYENQNDQDYANMQSAKDAIRKHLSKANLLTTTYVTKTDNRSVIVPQVTFLNSKIKRDRVNSQGMTEAKSLEEALPGQYVRIPYKQMNPGTNNDAINYYTTEFVGMFVNKNLIDQKYKEVKITEKDGTKYLTTEDKDYNEFVRTRFSVYAKPDVNGNLLSVKTSIEYRPTLNEYQKFAAAQSGQEVVTTSTEEALKDLNDKVNNLYGFVDRGQISLAGEDYELIKETLKNPTQENIEAFLDLYNSSVKDYVEDIAKEGIGEVSRIGNYAILKNKDGSYDVQHDDDGVIGESLKSKKEVNDLIKQDKAEREKENQEVSIKQKTGPSIADMSEEDLIKALRKKTDDDMYMSAQQKLTHMRATEAQLKRAEEWFSSPNNILGQKFPFRVMVNAVNISRRRGPAAKWAVDGIVLFHYYSEDGKFDAARSGDFTDLYHEAWHGFTQTFLTEDQRKQLYKEISKKKGGFTDYTGTYVLFSDAKGDQIEEWLAEDFRSWMMAGGKITDVKTPVKNSIFKQILDFLKTLFTGVKTQDVVLNPLGLPSLHTLYNQLQVGDLSMYKFDPANRDPGLDFIEKSMLARDSANAKQELDFDDAYMLVSTIDSLLSTEINKLVADDLDKGLITKIVNDRKQMAALYGLVKIRLTDIEKNLRKKSQEADNQINRLDYLNYANLVKWAIDEFGDLKDFAANRDGKGVIAYHQLKSKYIASEDRDAFFDDINEEKQIEKAKDAGFGEKGNEKNSLDLAAPEIHYILRGIHKYEDDKKTPVLNPLGVQEIMDYHDAWNKLTRVLQGSMSMEDMYNRMVKAAAKDAAIAEVLAKIGNPKNATSLYGSSLWIKFWSTFNLAEIKLVQMTLRKEVTETGQTRDYYSVRIGVAHSASNQIVNEWKRHFKSSNTHDYIERDRLVGSPTYNQNFLNLDKIYQAFSVNDKLKENGGYDFFRAIGIMLSPEARRGVLADKVGSPAQIFKRIKDLRARGINKVYSLDEIFNEYPETKINGKTFEALKDENTNLADLKELEASIKDIISNRMVSNAEGNSQSEQSLHNSISIYVSAINGAKTYQDLQQIPYMKHLNMDTNPLAPYMFLNSIFDLEETLSDGQPNPNYGNKRQVNGKDVMINMSNLSGVQLITEDGDQGIASAKADEFTKLILDFHLVTIAGKPELMRHADKSTSYSLWLDRIFNGSSNGKHYVDNFDFIETGDHITGFTKAAKILRYYVNGELKRINKLKEMSKMKDIVYDANYIKEGQRFLIFEDILSIETQNRLLKYENLAQAEEKDPSLRDKIEEEIEGYFWRETYKAENLIDKASFFSEKLVTDMRFKTGANTAQVKEALIKSFVVNSWIHNIETMGLVYGDIAQYNLRKEEFHKRNAGAGSTGGLTNTDPFMIDIINGKGRMYAKSKGFTEKKINRDGSIDTAILKDSTVKSQYYDKYLERFKKHYKETLPNLTQEEIDKKAQKSTDKYLENKEGDAQGWITFDFYRSLSMLQSKWSPAQEKLYREIVAGKPVDIKTITEFFPVRKLQYWGALNVGKDKNGVDLMPLNAMHKFSLMPLIPTVIEGTNLEELHYKMMKQGIDYSVFESGSKISTLTQIVDGESRPDLFYTDAQKKDFNYTDDNKVPDAEGNRGFTKNTIYLQLLKNQLEIAPYYKEKSTFPTQMRKLIEVGQMEGGVPRDFKLNVPLKERVRLWNKLGLTEDEYKKLINKETPEKEKKALQKKREDARVKESPKYGKIVAYESALADLTEFRKKELEEEAGITRKNGDIVMTPKLEKFLIKELQRMDLGDHEIDFIRKTASGKIARDFSVSLSADKIEKTLNAIVVNRLVKQVFNGEPLIQVSGAGFELNKTLRGRLTEEELKKYAGTNELPFYDFEYDKNGKPTATKAMKVKISLQGDFINLLYLKHNDGKVIGTRERLNQMLKDETWLNTGDHRKMIRIQGPRIPVQGLNSMEFAEVYEFLPTEAGNIIVLPTEIVTKTGGDFDIDKITFLFPNISSGINWKFWETEEGKTKLKQLATLNPEMADLFTETFVKQAIGNRKGKDKTDEEKKLLNILKDNSAKNITYPTNKTSAEGLENRVLDAMHSILEMPENFIDLVRPNDTDIVQPLASDLEEFVSQIDVKERNDKTYANRLEALKKKEKEQGLSEQEKATKEKLEKILKQIPGTRLFEVSYNLYKHGSNNIGKQTLGLAAVDNTYNSLWNRIGFHLNYSYNSAGTERKITIRLPHNTLLDEEGRDVVSLSHLYDVNNEHSISDVISQLINGYVDIAKDAWIFNLQGNKEISPTLLYMIQAGVPVDQAVYLVSNPLVREYVDQQRKAKSTFAEALGTAPSNPLFFRNQARIEMWTNPKYGLNFRRDALEGPGVRAEVREVYLYGETAGVVTTFLDQYGDNINKQSLLKNVKKYGLKTKAGEPYMYDNTDRAALLHFIELEDIAKSLTAIKTKTNVDTTKSADVFEAQNRIYEIEALKSDGKFPPEMIDKLLEDSPIASFYVQDFQSKLWSGFFKARHDQMFNDFLMRLVNSRKFLTFVDDTYGDVDRTIDAFRNDLVPFIFQNTIRSFDLDAMEYKGMKRDTSYPIQPVFSLKNSVFVKKVGGKRVFYVDKQQLQKDWLNLKASKAVIDNQMVTAEGKTVTLASINPAAFPTAGTYYNFVFERELLRSIYNTTTPEGKASWDKFTERLDYQDKLEAYKNLYKDKSEAEIKLIVYEETIRDIALENTYNTWHLFSSRESMGDKLAQIQEKYPELMKKYGIVNNLASNVSEGVNGVSRVVNIIMRDSLLDGDKINAFHQSLRELSDPRKIRINTENMEERKRVAKFFADLTMFSFLQAGMNTRGSYSLNRIVPQNDINTMVIPMVANFMNNMNNTTLNRYLAKFTSVAKQRKLRSKYKDYTIAEFNPAQDKDGKPQRLDDDLYEGESRFTTDNMGNEVYYPDEADTLSGKKVKDLTIKSAEAMAEDHADKVFLVDGAVLNQNGAPSKGAGAVVRAREKNGNIAIVPTKITFASTGAVTDIPADKAREIVDEMKKTAVNVTEEKSDTSNNTQPNVQKANYFMTFADGTKIPTTFPLNDQQVEALLELEKFYKNPNAYNNQVTLLGYAGTGKTTIISIFDKYLSKRLESPIYSAPTHRANAVTKLKNPKAKVLTLHKLFGLAPQIDLESDTYDAKELGQMAAKNRKKISPGDILIVDESSMVNDQLYEFLETSKKNLQLKLIYVGDPGQLRPVKSNTLSPVFLKGKQVQLTKVERTGDNPILEESTNLRNDKDLNYQTKVYGNEGVEYTNSDARFFEMISESFNDPRFKDNKLFVRVLSATNNKLPELNDFVRRALYGPEAAKEQIVEGEILMGYDNYGVDYETGEPKIINSGDYIVKQKERTQKRVEVSIEEDDKIVSKEIVFQGYKVTLGNILNPSADDVTVFIVANEDDQYHARLLAAAIDDNIRRAKKAAIEGRKVTSAELFRKADGLKSVVIFMKPLIGKDGKVKLKNALSYGYAHTIHKSQGGTYNRVIVAMDTVPTLVNFLQTKDKFSNKQNREYQQQLKYVAMSRASENVYILTKEQLKDPVFKPVNNKIEAKETVTRKDTKGQAVAAAMVLMREAPSKASNVRKDINMMKESDGFIGSKVPETSDSYKSATDAYRLGWGENANPQSFEGMNAVMISGSGTWNPAKTGGKLTPAQIQTHFNNFYVPLIDKAIQDGVTQFNVGIAPGIDKLATDYLKSKGFNIKSEGDWSRITTSKPTANVKPTVKDLSRWSDLSNATDPYTDNGIVVTRIKNTEEHFGNPFIGSQRRDKNGNLVKSKVDNVTVFNTIDEADQAYRDWLMGTKHQDIQPSRREWILKQINEGKLDGKTLLYYKPMEVLNNDGTKVIGGYHSHADTLAEIVQELRGAPVNTATVGGVQKVSQTQSNMEELAGFYTAINGPTINPRIKQRIDSLIDSLIEDKQRGLKPQFPAAGLGQALIGANEKTAVVNPNVAPVALETFLYLSNRLLKTFNYKNPNMDYALALKGQKPITTSTELEKQTEIEKSIPTDQEVEDQILNCLIKPR